MLTKVKLNYTESRKQYMVHVTWKRKSQVKADKCNHHLFYLLSPLIFRRLNRTFFSLIPVFKKVATMNGIVYYFPKWF